MRPAELRDLEEIFALRDGYYAARQAPVQIRDDVFWMVATIGTRVVACQGTIEEPRLHQRWQTDLYRCPGRAGTVGLYKLMAAEHDRAQADDIDLMGVTEPDNVRNLTGALAQGWQCAGIFIMRPRRISQQLLIQEAPCQV